MRVRLLRSLPLSAVLVAACAGDTFVPTAGGAGQGANGGSTAGRGGTPSTEGGAGGGGDAAGSSNGGNGASTTTAGSGGATEEGGMGGDAGEGGDSGLGGDTGQAGVGASAGAGQGATGGSAAGKGGASGKAGASGTSGGGGTTGGGGKGGVGGVGGSGGAAGSAPCDSTQCGTGQVCDSQGKCVACGETDTMVFGAATQRFRSSANGQIAMFPRDTTNFGARHLVFRMNAEGSANEQIFRVPLDGNGNPMGGPLPAPNYVNKPELDSGPLVLPAGHKLDEAKIFSGHGWDTVPAPAESYRLTLVDSARGGVRQVYVARWWFGAGGPGGHDGYAVLADFNTPTTDNFSVAYAWGISWKRAYWTRKAQTSPAELWTLVFGKDPSESTAQMVTLNGLPEGCALDDDAEAWIDPEARRLLFTARCNTGTPRRFFVAKVGATTTMPASLAATPVMLDAPGNNGELHTPSLSADQCTLWYSQAGAIFSAPRR